MTMEDNLAGELGDEFEAALTDESRNHRAGDPAGKVHSNGRRYIDVHETRRRI